MVRDQRNSARVRRGPQRGFTFVWVLAAIVILSIGLLAISEVWSTTARRQKLIQLDWIGTQFTQAIGSYYYATPNADKSYPASLQDLIEDRRYATTRRHLREIYRNPFTGAADWQLITATDGRIRGVRADVPSDSGTSAKEYLFRP